MNNIIQLTQTSVITLIIFFVCVLCCQSGSTVDAQPGSCEAWTNMGVKACPTTTACVLPGILQNVRTVPWRT